MCNHPETDCTETPRQNSTAFIFKIYLRYNSTTVKAKVNYFNADWFFCLRTAWQGIVNLSMYIFYYYKWKKKENINALSYLIGKKCPAMLRGRFQSIAIYTLF